ncbi:MAG: 50S ribosomal protein L9 [Dehalococcoidia bacterium]
MKVVFLEEVEGTARTGDVKNVANGFARNYLLPRKLAAPATDHYIAIASQKATKQARRQDRLDDEARSQLLPLVEGRSITIEVRVGEQDKLFGSVTARDIAERLQELTKVELEHRQVDLKQPIRDLGAHEVPIKLTRNVIATVTVNVEPIGGVAEAAEAPAAEAPADESPAESEAAEEAPVTAEIADANTTEDETTNEASEGKEQGSESAESS